MNKLNKQNIKIIASWTIVVLWLALIFTLSSQPAIQSNSLSKKVTEIVMRKVGSLLPLSVESSTTTDMVSHLNNFIRKSAHFGIYFILAILVMNALNQSKIKGFRAAIFTLIFCILYAASDEAHQLFVPGRGAQIADVIIDSTGAFLGILVYVLIFEVKILSKIFCKKKSDFVKFR